MKKIKILDSTTIPNLEKSINKYLRKGWKIKGNVFNGCDCSKVVLYKK